MNKTNRRIIIVLLLTGKRLIERKEETNIVKKKRPRRRKRLFWYLIDAVRAIFLFQYLSMSFVLSRHDQSSLAFKLFKHMRSFSDELIQMIHLFRWATLVFSKWHFYIRLDGKKKKDVIQSYSLINHLDHKISFFFSINGQSFYDWQTCSYFLIDCHSISEVSVSNDHCERKRDKWLYFLHHFIDLEKKQSSFRLYLFLLK